MPPPSSSGLQGAVGLGYQLLAAMLIFVGGGYWLDQRRGGGTAFTLGGVALAFIYGVYEVWKLVRQIDREERDAKK
jgi:F0F1-type ATP synthase assembly protein I